MIDIDRLMTEISPEVPCGDNLEYDPTSGYGALELAAEVKPERQLGETIIPAEEPVWRAVQGMALDLFAKTLDLRVAVLLIRALTHTEGWTGFRDGLALMQGLLERYWETVHPQLDPDDGNDPTFRVNTIASLSDGAATLDGLRSATLVEARGIGCFSLRDVEIANGERSAPKDAKTPPPEPQMIAAAFQDADLEQLQTTASALNQTLTAIASIESILLERVGPSEAPDLGALVNLVKSAQKTLIPYLAERDEAAALEDGVADDNADGAGDLSTETASAPSRAALNAINSRDDVARAIDLICAYYARQEPSSPIPILLKRAKRLVAKDFMDILRDLTPAGVPQLEVLKGPDTEG